MVKRLLTLVLLVVLLVAAGLVAWGWWLLRTEAGVRWLLAEVSRWSAVTIEVEEIDGRLLDRLELRGVDLRWKEGDVRVDSLGLTWHPEELLTGRVAIDQLSLAGGTVAWSVPPDGESGGGIPFAWPRVSGWPLSLRGTVGALRLDNLELRPPEGEVERVDHLSAHLEWDGGSFAVTGLEAASPDYRLQGSATVGFGQPLLLLDLKLALSKALAGIDGLTLQADLSPAAPADLTGPLELRGKYGSETRLLFEAELEVLGDIIRMRRFELTSPGRTGKLSGAGEAELAAGKPRWSLQAACSSLDLGPLTGVETDLTGSLEATGTGAGYSGSFDLANRRPGWRSLRLSGPFAGNADGIDFPQLAGAWLRGTLGGKVHLAWTEGFTLAAAVQGSRLDPAVISADWPGRVNLDVAADLAWPESAPPTAHLRGRLLESTLRGKALAGKVEAELAGADLRIDALELHGDGFDLSGQGRLAERISFQAEVARLSGLVPGARGAFSSRGWFRWRNGEVAGEADLHGRQLAYDDLGVARLQLAVHLPGGGQPMTVSAKGGGVDLENWHLQSVAIDLSGLPESHVVGFQAVWAQGELLAEATGSWREGLWKGTLRKFLGDDAEAGSWRLAAPAEVEVAAHRAQISSMRLNGRAGEWLSLDGSGAWEPLRGEAEVQWKKLDLSRLDPLLAGVTLAGHSDGKANVRWQERGAAEISGQLSASGRVTYREQAVAVRELSVAVDWSGKGLLSHLEVELDEGGTLNARLSSPEPLRPHLPRQGETELGWQNFDLSLLGPWLAPVVISGKSSGSAHLRWNPGFNLAMTAEAEANGKLAMNELRLEVRLARAELAWDAGGLRSSLAAELKDGGRLGCRLSSDQPARLEFPVRGRIEADWGELELDRLRPWLPQGLEASGRFEGEAAGEWLPGWELSLSGEAGIGGGRVAWRGEEGEVAVDLRTARLEWEWAGKTLAGKLELALAEKGAVQGSFQLPLPARLPTEPDPDGNLRLVLEAKVRELGLLAFFFPGLVRESHGDLELNVQAGGTWQSPNFCGTMRLTGGGAYFPPAGVELREVELTSSMTGDELRIESFSARSGPGRVTGSGSVHLPNWQISRYQGHLKGERFEAVNLPELQLLVNPDLTVEGDAEHLQVRGEVQVPELTLHGREQREVIRESPDTVVLERAPVPEGGFPVALDVQIHLVLGDRVLVKAAGVDARLAGELDLRIAGPDVMTGRGEIRTVEGTYSTYGVRLKIVRGRLLFSGGPIELSILDILALRTVGEVKAGVQASGTLRAPVIKLYSEPAMPDTDILAYIVLGHPLGGESSQASVLTTAAAALLSTGESTMLQDRVKRRLGIDVLSVESGRGEVGESMVTIGKYITPKLFLSLGQSLFTDTSEARLRYSISKKWELESKVGTGSSGADLFYKIEFD